MLANATVGLDHKFPVDDNSQGLEDYNRHHLTKLPSPVTHIPSPPTPPPEPPSPLTAPLIKHRPLYLSLLH